MTAAAKGQNARVRVYVPNKRMDAALTAAFFLELVFLAYASTAQEKLWLLASIACAGVVVTATKAVARYLGGFISSTLLAGAPFHDPLRNPKTMAKFCDQAWQLAVHLSMSVLEVYCLCQVNWFQHTDSMWLPFTARQNHSTALRVMYILQLGIWVYTCFSHRFIEERRKDYFVMYTHHVSTIALVAGSYFYDFLRIGLLVLAVHDTSDVPVDTLKMVNYLKLEGPRGLFLSEIVFVSTLVTWGLFRLFTFGVYILYSTIVECHSNVVAGPTAGKWWLNPVPREVPIYALSNVLLILLYCLHVWWGYLLVRMLFKLLRSTSAHNVGREEYEGASASDTEHDPKKQ